MTRLRFGLPRHPTAASLLLALASGPLVAQTAGQDTSRAAPDLSEIIVTARSLEATIPLELAEYGNDVEMVTAEQIRNHGFVDMTQALEMLVPGAFVTTQAGAFSYINLSLQGSRTSDVLWTVDGVRINNRLYNSTSPADTLPSSMIERMEVLKAGQGVLYGTQAVAGVINVVTRGFSDTPGGAVSMGTDTRGGLHADGYARGAIGNHRLVGWASKNETEGYRLYDVLQPGSTTRRRQYDVRSAGVKYGYDFTDDLRLTLQAIHTEAALDYPGVASTSVNDRDEEIVSGRLEFAPDGPARFFLKGYWHDWDTDYYPSTDPAASLYWGYEDFGLGAGTRLALHRGFEYDLGYDFQNYKGRDEVLLIDGRTEQVHAAYGQLRTTADLLAKARFAAGVRHNRGGGADATVWSVSGVYHFSEFLHVEAVIGTAFLLPDAEKLYSLEPDVKGNPDLAPEESRNLNLAIGGQFALGNRPFSWQLSGWQRRIDNLFSTDSANPPAGFDSVYINIDAEVKVSGGELLLRGALTDALSFDASYTYSRELARGTTSQIADRPRRSGKAGLSYAPGHLPFGTDFAVKYVGSTTTTVAGFGTQNYGDYFVANLGGYLFLDGQGRRHRLGARIENVFDEGYATRIRSAVLAGSNPAERFMYRNLGAPRTGYLNYSYAF